MAGSVVFGRLLTQLKMDASLIKGVDHSGMFRLAELKRLIMKRVVMYSLPSSACHPHLYEHDFCLPSLLA